MDDCACTSGAGEQWKVFHCQLHGAAPDLLAACKAFVEAYEKSLQLVKTDVALRMAKQAIEKAQGDYPSGPAAERTEDESRT